MLTLLSQRFLHQDFEFIGITIVASWVQELQKAGILVSRIYWIFLAVAGQATALH